MVFIQINLVAANRRVEKSVRISTSSQGFPFHAKRMAAIIRPLTAGDPVPGKAQQLGAPIPGVLHSAQWRPDFCS